MVLSSILVLLVMLGLIGRDLTALWSTEVEEENRELALVAEALRAEIDAQIAAVARAQADVAAALANDGLAVILAAHPIRTPGDGARLEPFLSAVAANSPKRMRWSIYDPAGQLIADGAEGGAAAQIELGGPPWLKGDALGHSVWLAQLSPSSTQEGASFALATRGPPAGNAPGTIIVTSFRIDLPPGLLDAARDDGIAASVAGPAGFHLDLRPSGPKLPPSSADSVRLASQFLPMDFVASRDHGGIVKALVLRHLGLMILGVLVGALVLFQTSLALQQAQRIDDQGHALRQSIEATIRESQAKTTLLANMSHELRTPLNAIIGFADLMREQMFGPIGSERYRGYVADISDAGRHMLGLVEDLLNYTSMGAQIRKLTPVWLDSGDVLAACAQMVQPEARQAGIDLIVAAPADLPRIHADERAMRQILLNLLSNAIKFTPQGGSVTLACARELDGLVIEVIDTGIGIKGEDLMRVFDPFVQSSPAISRSRSGIGLGLAIVKGLTEASGFTISIASEPGIGTTFRIAIPLDKTRPRNVIT